MLDSKRGVNLHTAPLAIPPKKLESAISRSTTHSGLLGEFLSNYLGISFHWTLENPGLGLERRHELRCLVLGYALGVRGVAAAFLVHFFAIF